MCPPGQELDPRESCLCAPEEEVRALYPSWASIDEIIIAKKEDYVSQMAREDSIQVCPYSEDKSCPKDQWNELACECFSLAHCRKGCPNGRRLDPTEMCGECLNQTEMRQELYPVWATPYDI